MTQECCCLVCVCVSFGMCAESFVIAVSGKHVAKFTLLTPIARPGLEVRGVFEFVGATLPCKQVPRVPPIYVIACTQALGCVCVCVCRSVALWSSKSGLQQMRGSPRGPQSCPHTNACCRTASTSSLCHF